MQLVTCSTQTVEETLGHLQEAGRRRSECVVLWLGRETYRGIEVEAVCRPAQVAGSDIFRIPPAAMREVMNILAANEWMIAAQVHSHPLEAFHSEADDRWAIVRHENALSLVVPYFAQRTDARSFTQHQKTFRLDAGNCWREVHATEMGRWWRVA